MSTYCLQLNNVNIDSFPMPSTDDIKAIITMTYFPIGPSAANTLCPGKNQKTEAVKTTDPPFLTLSKSHPGYMA